MVSNLIKLSLGSLVCFFIMACISKPQNTAGSQTIMIDTCKYYKYNSHQVISNLGCYNCHVRAGDRWYDMPTFSELSQMDSLMLIDYAFTKKHKGLYSKTGTFKASRMDTLSDCEIKSVIRYIKDFGRDIPMAAHKY